MNYKSSYDVIIIGGGPVGVALGIELGLQNIKTLILEKHERPLHTPRAQSLSARTMEFFLRWGIDKKLEENLLLSDLPQTGVWCSTLCDDPYFICSWGDNRLDNKSSPKKGVRVPLWITEEILRDRLKDFESVDFITNYEVQDVYSNAHNIVVQSYDKVNNRHESYTSSYLVCCDGAAGISKAKFNNSFANLSEKTKMLCTLFTTKAIMKTKLVPDSIMYFVMSEDAMAFFGPIDLRNDLWLAQIVWNNSLQLPDEATLSATIDKIVGAKVEKTINDYYFWDMQVQLADFFSLDNRIFWAGDAAHAFAPTGGLGLNTGFGDAQNLGWKLAAVINNIAPVKLLSTYEQERMPVCLNNLNFAKQNAEEFIQIKKKYLPDKDYKAFVLAYAELGNSFLSSSGLTLGYTYLDSPLTQTLLNRSDQSSPFEYKPIVEPGYFLPHVDILDESIYQKLSSTEWNLIISDKTNAQDIQLDEIKARFSLNKLNILEVDPQLYPHSYILIRPDWHIARVGDCLESISGSVWEKCQ